jgi:hypothetical protein
MTVAIVVTRNARRNNCHGEASVAILSFRFFFIFRFTHALVVVDATSIGKAKDSQVNRVNIVESPGGIRVSS